MDVLAAYREVGSYRGAAEICGTTHKTVKRIVERHDAGDGAPERKDRGHNYDDVTGLVAEKVESSMGRISAKRLLPAARAAGYAGSARNFRRLVAEAESTWRRPSPRPPPGGLDAWGHAGHRLGCAGRAAVFCAVLAWSRVRFVRFAADEKAVTTGDAGRMLRGPGWGAEDRAGRPDGLPERRRRREPRGADPGLHPVRHPLPVD